MKLMLMHTTTANEDQAKGLAQELIAHRLAACVAVGAPVRSYYVWQGRSEVALEYPLTIKTTDARVAAVKDFLRTFHPYDLPEILVQQVDDATEDYIEWVRAQVS